MPGNDDIVDLAQIGFVAGKLYSIDAGNTRTTARVKAHWVTPSGGELVVRLLPPYPGCNRRPQYTIGTPGEFRLLITNRTPGISITASAASVEEGGSVTFTLTRTWNPENTASFATHVDLHFEDPDGVISGTPPRFVTIPKGRPSATFTIQTTENNADEEDREFTVSVAAPENPHEQTFEGEFQALAPHTVTVTVTDDDPTLPTVKVTPASPRGDWEGTRFGFWVAIDTKLEADLTVKLDVSQDGDFLRGTPDTEITIPAGRGRIRYTVRTRDDDIDEPHGTISVIIEEDDAYNIGDPWSARVPVYDNDGPTLSIEGPASPVEEGNTNATFTVSLTRLPESGGRVSTTWHTSPDTAESPSDYDHSTGTISFTSTTSLTRTITVPIKEDTEDEDDETFHVVLNYPQGADLAKDYATAVIADDDDPAVTASIEAVPESDVPESASHVEFLVRLSGPSQRIVEVDWEPFGGSGNSLATAGADFSAAGGTATFPPGPTEQRIRVAVRDDDVDEEYPAGQRRHAERLRVELTDARHASVSTEAGKRNASGWIRDDDVRGVTASPTTLSIAEGGRDSYTLSLDSRPTSGEVTVTVTVPAGSDLSVNPSELTFTRPNWDRPRTVTVSAAADADSVADPPATITHSASGADYGTAPTDSVTVTITGDTGAALAVADAGAVEGEGEIVFTVTLLGTYTSDVTVNYATSDGTATAGQDYTSKSGTLTFAAGGAKTQTVAVPLTDDSAVESTETFTLTLTSPTNAVLGDASATGTITDDDQGLAVTRERNTETGGEIVFTVTRLGSASGSVHVFYATEDGTATAGSDYSSRSGQLRFLAGETSKTVPVPIVNDLLDEADEETFILRLSRSSNAVIAPGKESAAGIIADDDPLPRVFFESPGIRYANENEGPLEFPVKLSAASGQRVTVDYATREKGEAEAGSDFVAAAGALAFEPGETEKSVTVQLVDDNLAEPREDFLVGLSTAVNAVISQNTAAGTIWDNDQFNVTVTAREATATEGSVLLFDLERDADPHNALTVTLGRTVTTDSLTMNHGDVTVTFAGANPYSGAGGKSTATYRWQSDVDLAGDSDRVFTVTVKNDPNTSPKYKPGTPDSASVRVTDVGTSLVLSYEKLDSSWAGVGDKVRVKWTVINTRNTAATNVKIKTDRTEGTHDCADSLGEEETCTVTVAYAATAADVTAKKLTIEASATSDSVDDSNEVEVVFPQGGEHVLAITHVASIDEYGHPAVKFTVTLDEQSAQPVTVDYAPSDGTATGKASETDRPSGCGGNYVSGFDYLKFNGTETFEPGDTEKIVFVRVCDDRLLEGDETIIFTISNPAGATLDPDRSSATGTIIDDEADPTNLKVTISRDSGEVAEDAGYAEFVVTLSARTRETVAVDWATQAATGENRSLAAAGMDYTAGSGTVTFPSRTTEQRIRVPILDDMMDEPDLEYLQVALSNPVRWARRSARPARPRWPSATTTTSTTNCLSNSGIPPVAATTPGCPG